MGRIAETSYRSFFGRVEAVLGLPDVPTGKKAPNKTNLSAYIDNELNDLDNIKIKKIAISNPLARQDLENIYSFKKFLHSSFEKTKNEMKHDYSKSIISQIQHETTYYKRQDPFHKIITTFFLLITFLVTGLIIILYF